MRAAGARSQTASNGGVGRQEPAGRRRAVEWPTLGLALGIYAAFGLLTWFHATLPWWLLLALGGYLVCLHGSLQHEVAHGHPTPWPRINEALVLPSLWLWLPFRIYRETHLVHHRDARLTDPTEDPESYYVTAESWAGRGPLQRAFLWLNNTVTGRLLLGPPRAVARLLQEELAALLRGDSRHLRAWLWHLVGVALVLAWVLAVCGLDLWLYLLCFAYPGTALTLLRSFLEHQAVPAVGERSVVIEAGPVMSLMFLNNNLHALHHAEPKLAWYRLPARYRQRRDALLEANGGYLFRGYWEVVARYLLWPKEPPVHPFADTAVVITKAHTAGSLAEAR